MAAAPPDDDHEGEDDEIALPAHHPGDVLPYRLDRRAPWGAQAGCAAILGLFLSALGGTFVYLELRNDGAGLGSVVGGLFALVGLLVLVFGGLHQIWARMQTAETLFEIETLRVARGASVRFCVIQPGPADFQSLRVKVVCERSIVRPRSSGKGTERDARLIHDHCPLELTDIAVARGHSHRHEGILVVPRDQPPTGGLATAESPAHEWQIEIWGRVRNGPDVLHPFVIHVD